MKGKSVSSKKERKEEIEISLGSEASAGKTTMYKSLRSLLTDVCMACPRKEESKSEFKLAEDETEVYSNARRLSEKLLPSKKCGNM